MVFTKMENERTDLISVVIPVYGCERCLIELANRIIQTIQSIPADYEIIMVNDASPDHAWETILKLHQKDKKIKGIILNYFKVIPFYLRRLNSLKKLNMI